MASARDRLRKANQTNKEKQFSVDKGDSMVDLISGSDGSLIMQEEEPEERGYYTEEIPTITVPHNEKEQDKVGGKKILQEEIPTKKTEQLQKEAPPPKESKKKNKSKTMEEVKPERLNNVPAGRAALKSAMKKDAQLCVILEKDMMDTITKCHRMETTPCSMNEYLFKVLEEEMNKYEKAKGSTASLEKYGKECLVVIENDAASARQGAEKKSFTVRVTKEVRDFVSELAWVLYVNKADVFRMAFIKDCDKKLGKGK